MSEIIHLSHKYVMPLLKTPTAELPPGASQKNAVALQTFDIERDYIISRFNRLKHRHSFFSVSKYT